LANLNQTESISLEVIPRTRLRWRFSPIVVRYGLAALYACVYAVGYVTFVHRNYDYAGFNLVEPFRVGVLLAAVGLAMAPLTAYRGARAISSVVAAIIYYILYVPIIMTFALASEAPDYAVVLIEVNFAAGMTLLFLVDRFRLVLPRAIKLRLAPSLLTLMLALAGCVYIYALYRGNLRFASYDEVYEQRFANAALGASVVASYLSAWFANAVLPVCLAYGTVQRRWLPFLAGSAGCLMVYMATAAKSVLLFPVMSVGLALVLNPQRVARAFEWLGLSLVLVMVASLPLGMNSFNALFWMRTVGNSGSLTLHYFNFFAEHPKTYFTHINVINKLTGLYPYGDDIVGQVVGRYYWTDETCANASFWATDGIAALGLPGILVSSLLLAGILAVLNALVTRANILFALIALIPFISSLLNTSLFSSMWTGGGFFVFFLFWLLKARTVLPSQATD
jgi:hypothetical protein